MTQAAATPGVSTRDLMYRLGQSSPDAAIRYQHASRERDTAIADSVSDRLASARSVPAPPVAAFVSKN